MGRHIYGKKFDGAPIDPLAVPLLDSVSLLIASMAWVLVAAAIHNIGRGVWLASQGRW